MMHTPEIKAALAFLDELAHVVNGTDPDAMMLAAAEAIAFFDTIHPETADEYEGVRYALDSVAAVQHRALVLLGVDVRPWHFHADGGRRDD